MAVALLLLPSTVLAQSQPFDLSVESVSISGGSQIVLDKANTIVGVVKNNGNLPVQASVTLTASNDDHPNAFQTSSQTDPIAGGASQQVSFTWDGRYIDLATGDRLPLQGSIELTIRASPVNAVQSDPVDGNNADSLDTSLRFHRFTLASAAPGSGEQMSVGQEWTTFVTISNDGNGYDNATLAPSGGTTGWTFRILNGVNRIEFPTAGSQSGFFVGAMAPASAAAGSSGSVTITATSEENPAVSFSHPITTPTVAASGTLTLALSVASGTVAPGGSVPFQATVTNLQNHDETVRLQLEKTSGDAGLAPVITPAGPVTLAPAASGAFGVDIPVSAQAAAGNTSWNVRAFSTTDPEVFAVAPFTLTVTQFYQVGIELVNAPSSVQPGATFPVTVRLRNTGNGFDTVRAELRDAPAGWTSAGTQAPLNRGDNSEKTLSVAVPTDSTPGLRSLVVKARSLTAATVFQEVALAVNVVAKARPATATDFLALPIQPDQQRTFNLTVTNIGNTADTFELEAWVNSTSVPLTGWSPLLTPGTMTLQPGAQQNATLQVRAPSGLQPQMAGLRITVFANATNGASSHQDFSAGPAFPDLQAQVLGMTPSPAYKGQQLSVSVRIINVGTADTPKTSNASVEVRTGAQNEFVKKVTFPVPVLRWQGTPHQIDLTTALPSNVDRVTVLAQADSTDDVPQFNTANDEDTEVFLLRNLDISLTTPADMLGTPGVAVSFTGQDAFRARNTGTNTTSLRLRVVSEPDWFTREAEFPDVGPGQSVFLPVDFVVPPEPSAEQAVFKLVAFLASDPTVNISKSMTIRVPDKSPPKISGVSSANSTVAVGESTTVSAIVHDASGINGVKLQVIAPSGQVTSTAMTHAGSQEYTAKVRLTSPGVHKAFVSAEDKSAARNTNSTQTKPILIRAEGPAADAVLRLVSPANGSFVRPGTPLLVSFQSRNAIQAADYTVQGQRTPLTPITPLQIPTDGWPDGSTDVLVRIRDASGNYNGSVFSLRFDGSPPAITNLSRGDAKPVAGQPVSISATIRDASGVQNASLRIERAGSAALLVLLTSAGADLYNATVIWSNDFGTVAVFAQDIMGNAGYSQLAAATLLEISPTPKGGSSPLPASLLLLALIAVVMGRRTLGVRP